MPGKKNILIFDPVGGASGDMILSSLIHMGCPVKHIKGNLEKLGLGKSRLLIKEKEINGIMTFSANFKINEQVKGRTYSDIKNILTGANIEDAIIERSIKIFDILAKAESDVHGVKPCDVHFHELGALDSIFDIVGISAAVEWFNPDVIYNTPLPLGSGITNSMHGLIPVPAPATLKLLEGLETKNMDIKGELTTPTGAAVIRALSSGAPRGDFVINSSGYGSGQKTFDKWPNIFRSISAESKNNVETIYIVETDIDDMNPEEFNLASKHIIKAGAIDVILIPVIMKSSRPAVTLKAITQHKNLLRVTDAVLKHTTTIGLRYFPVQRRILDREELSVDTCYGKIDVKIVKDSDYTRHKAEYRDVENLSLEKDIPAGKIKKEIDQILKGNR